MFEFMERMLDKQFQHKWINNRNPGSLMIWNDQEYICEKCETVSWAKWPGGSCLLSDDEFMIKQIIE
jgi:hypothetical protein